MRFSEKYGYSEPRHSIQVEELDETTRNRLWNVFWNVRFQIGEDFSTFYGNLWHEHFGIPVDSMENKNDVEELRTVFMGGEWYELIDLLEYISEYDSEIGIENDFNDVLEEEKSAYRIIEGEAVPVSDGIELEAIEEGMERTRKYEGVREHLEQALAHFSDEDDPDYRNSVKESISAVE